MGGAIEIVDDSCGVLVDAHDPVALADALRRLIVDRTFRAALATAAPARARQLCDPHTQMERLADALAAMPAARVETHA
jgi:glycosyltransferase involved in cell wall biosynthesis